MSDSMNLNLNHYDDCTLEGILAYQQLESETFNFGQGNIKIEGLYGFESVYYRLAILSYENLNKTSCELNMSLTDGMCEWCDRQKVKSKNRYNYNRKRFEKNKLNKLQKNTNAWWTVQTKYNEFDAEYKIRNYLSKRRSGRCNYHKKLSNKKVRRCNGKINKGGSYRKIYDYWWEII